MLPHNLSTMSRTLLSIFEDYNKARNTFVQSIAELAIRNHNIDALHEAGIIPLLRPLLLDSIPSIQITAATALGRLANQNEKFAEEIVDHHILPQVVYSLTQPNKNCKRAAAFVIRNVAKHSATLAKATVNAHALDGLARCLEDLDPEVRKSAAWAMGYISRHSIELAQSVVDMGIIQLLASCYQECDATLKRVVSSALSDIAKHSPTLAQLVSDTGIIDQLASDLNDAEDSKLKQSILGCFGQIAKHSPELARAIVSKELFPRSYILFKEADELIRKNLSTLIREIVRHDIDLTGVIVNSGGIAATIDNISESKGLTRLPGIMTLGYISGFSESLAYAVISAKGVPLLVDSLDETESQIKASAAWALYQVGHHSPEHALKISETGCLKTLLSLYNEEEANEELGNKVKSALKGILEKCTYLPALEQLLDTAPPTILRLVLVQFGKVLPNDAQGRKMFAQNGALKKILSLDPNSALKLTPSINEIRRLFPAEVVNYYSPNYSEVLAQKIDNYPPHSGRSGTVA